MLAWTCDGHLLSFGGATTGAILAAVHILVFLHEGSAKSSGTRFGSLAPAEVASYRSSVREAWTEAGGRCLAAREAVGSGGQNHGEKASAAPGCQMDFLLPALRFVYQSPDVSGAILDVGAHVGHWAAEVLTVFGRLEFRKYTKEFGTDDRCPPPAPKGLVSLYCFEPVQKNYERLSDRAKRSAWQLEGFSLMRAGISNVSGKAPIWAASGIVDPQASTWPREGFQSTMEKMVTLDLLLKKSVSEGKAFLVRIAINGHEHAALLGLKKSLKKNLVRFVLFEVSTHWESAGHKFGDAVSMMWKVGYACFALLPKPVPVSGPFWPEVSSMESGSGPQWFYTLCARLTDVSARRVFRILDPDSPEYFVEVNRSNDPLSESAEDS